MFERSTSDARPIGTDGENDSHRCHSGGGCVNADVSDHDPDTRRPIRRGALVSDGPLCPGCLLRLSKAVKAMSGDYERLAAAIGESVAGGGDKVHLTREAAIPINTATEALMSRIVETTTRAAEMVAAAMNMEPREWPANPSAALRLAVRMLEPTLPVLIAVEPQPALVWSRIPYGDEGWEANGQPTELVDRSGLDMALELLEIGRLVGVQLGKSHLRHELPGPCSAWDEKAKRFCGAYTVGRDNGSDFVDCTTCGTRWPSAHFPILVRLQLNEIQEREEYELLRYLLAEAYARLDELQAMAARLDGDGALDLPGAGALLLGRVQEVLDGHLPPAERNVGTESKKQKAIPAAKRKAIEA